MKKKHFYIALAAVLSLPACQLEEVNLDCPVITGISTPRAGAGEQVTVNVENLRLGEPGSYELRVGGRLIPIQSVDTVNQRVVFEVQEGMQSGAVSLRLKQFACDTSGNGLALSFLEYRPKADPVRSGIFAGSPWQGDFRDGKGSDARFKAPSGLAADTTSGAVFVADLNNYAVRKIDALGNVELYAGNRDYDCKTNSANKFNSSFRNPAWLAFSHATGHLYLADRQCNRIYEISNATNELAGGGGNSGAGCFSNNQVQFSEPEGVVVSGNGEIYMVDFASKTIRRISGGQTCNISSGGPALQPFTLALDEKNGTLYFSDSNTGSIYRMNLVELEPELLVFAPGSASVGSPAGMAVGEDGNLYIADAAAGKVLRYYRESGFLQALSLPFEDSLAEPWGLAYDSKRKRLYLSDRSLQVVFVIYLV